MNWIKSLLDKIHAIWFYLMNRWSYEEDTHIYEDD
mgnify:FL=1